MRPIEFRGYASWEKKWYFGYLIISAEGRHLIRCNSENGKEFYMQVKNESVGQFTGMYAKNGVKIFEGDILA